MDKIVQLNAVVKQLREGYGIVAKYSDRHHIYEQLDRFNGDWSLVAFIVACWIQGGRGDDPYVKLAEMVE